MQRTNGDECVVDGAERPRETAAVRAARSGPAAVHAARSSPAAVHAARSSPAASPTRRGLLAGAAGAPLLAALAPRAAAGAARDGADAPDARTVILVRHAEKAQDDPRDPGLSEVGVRRAAALAALLAGAGVTHVFATDYRRTRDTAGPVAADGALEVASYDPRDPAAVAKRVAELPAGSIALVVGHSNTTPQLYTALGADEPGGLEDSPYGRKLPEDVYDRVYVATLVRLQDGARPRCVAGLELRYGE